MNNPIRIFLSYARVDEAPVKALYQRLKDRGFAPWMDTEDLLPGERFEYAIRQAIRSSDFFLACLTCNSANRRGVIQKEIREALEVLQEKLEEDIFLILVRLEACDVPEALRAFHWADLHDAAGFDKLLRALQREIEKQQRELPAAHEGQVKSLSAENSSQAWTEPHTGMEFVWIPPGRFWMGQTEEEKACLLQQVSKDIYQQYYARELPRHEVQITAGFWLGKYAMTNAQYRLFKPDHDSGTFRGHTLNGDSQPVVMVSWDEANAFAAWLTTQHNGRHVFALPSEAQWEYACRAGTTTMRYWGDSPDEASRYANVADMSLERDPGWQAWLKENNYTWSYHNCDDGHVVTAPVGSFLPNAFGLYDMLGNVYEWCEDMFDSDAYTKHSPHNPLISSDGSNRVMRGGSWDSEPRGVRSAGRDAYAPSGRNDYVGLRLVRKK